MIAAGALAVGSVPSLATAAEKPTVKAVPKLNGTPVTDQRYKATVPDTLDMAYRGELAINGVIGSINTNRKDHEISFLNILDVNPAYMLHYSSMVSGVQPKYIELFPLLRKMTGSNKFSDVEKGFVDAMLRNASEDGLIYDCVKPDRPWNTGVGYGKKEWDEDYANMAGNGRYLTGLTHYCQMTGDEEWKKRAKKTAERMLELAIVEDDLAWYPNPGLGNDFSYPRKSGWTTKEPPTGSSEGFEGATAFYLCQPLRGFTRYYQMTGDERFLELSKKFAKMAFKPDFWIRHNWAGGFSSMQYPDAAFRNGFFLGHFHGVLGAIRPLLDYAILANDNQIKDWARNCYEYAKNQGISKLGVFPHNTADFATEGCTIADMIGLAVALTDAGLGDYWDDVEQYTRNGLVNVQPDDIDELKRVSFEGRHRPKNSEWGGAFDGRFRGSSRNTKGALKGQEITDRILERTIGAFGHLRAARYMAPMMMHCCTANCSQALYYTWEGIIKKSSDMASVNMWLNRRSPWLDVESHLPYNGSLVINNKGMKSIAVRKPGWINAEQIKCTVNGKEVQPIWLGNRMIFNGLNGRDSIAVSVPVKIEKVDMTLTCLNSQDKNCGKYACQFKGNTAVKVERTESGIDKSDKNWYRIFRRDHMLADTAPKKKTSAYIHPEKLIKWNI